MTPDVSPISEQRIKTLYPGLRPLAYRVLQDTFTITRRTINVVQAMRSQTEQLETYSKGRKLISGIWKVTDKGKVVTNARPGMSWHNFGLAFDCAWAGLDPYLVKEDEGIKDRLWRSYGTAVEGNSLEWGGHGIVLINGVRDLPHAQKTWGLTIQQAMELDAHGGVDSVWAHLDKQRGLVVGEGWLHENT